MNSRLASALRYHLEHQTPDMLASGVPSFVVAKMRTGYAEAAVDSEEAMQEIFKDAKMRDEDVRTTYAGQRIEISASDLPTAVSAAIALESAERLAERAEELDSEVDSLRQRVEEQALALSKKGLPTSTQLKAKAMSAHIGHALEMTDYNGFGAELYCMDCDLSLASTLK